MWSFFWFSVWFQVFWPTADLVTVVSDRIARTFNRSGATQAVALDISKAFFTVLTKTWNKPKWPEMNQIDLKQSETTRNQLKRSKILRNDLKQPKLSKVGKSGIFYLLLFFKFLTQMPKFGYFGPKSVNFLIFTKFHSYPILKVLIPHLTLVFKNLPKSSQIWAFWAKKCQLSNLKKILSVPYFEGADFKSDFHFQKFQAQIPKSGHFGPKSISFLILKKFCLNLIWKMVTFVFENFEPKSPNFGVLGQTVSTFKS